MDLKTKILEDSLFVQIIGELDHHSSEDIRKKLDAILALKSIKNIVFDLSQMNFMDSSGIGIFMGRYKKIKDKKGIGIMVGIQDSNRRLLKMSGLLNIYKEYKDVNQAISAIGRIKDE